MKIHGQFTKIRVKTGICFFLHSAKPFPVFNVSAPWPAHGMFYFSPTEIIYAMNLQRYPKTPQAYIQESRRKGSP